MPSADPTSRGRGLAAVTALIVAFGVGMLAGRVVLPARPADGTGPSPQDPTDESVGRGPPARPADPVSREAGHEISDVQAGAIARLILLLGVCVILVVGGMIGFRILVTAAQHATSPTLTALQSTPVAPPPPHMQADPAKELADISAVQRRAAESYGWNDAGHSRAHIPIAQAMPLLVGHSLDGSP